MPPDKLHQKIISVSNQKGGVGKTTTSFQVSIYLAGTGRKTLLIDADPQGNLTKSLIDTDEPGLYEALTGADASTSLGTSYNILEIMPNLFLLAGSIRLAILEKSLIGEMDAYIRLRELLSLEIFSEFDYIFIDTPPSLGALTINALTASKYIIAPMSPAIYSLQGTNDLMATVAKVKKNLNPELALLGVIINAYDAHPVISRQIREEIIQSFGDKVFRTALSRSVKLEEALAARRGVAAGESKAGDEIKLISEELIERIDGRERTGKVEPRSTSLEPQTPKVAE